MPKMNTVPPQFVEPKLWKLVKKPHGMFYMGSTGELEFASLDQLHLANVKLLIILWGVCCDNEDTQKFKNNTEEAIGNNGFQISNESFRFIKG